MFSSIQRSLNVLYGAPVRRNFIFERFFAVVIAMAAILIDFCGVDCLHLWRASVTIGRRILLAQFSIGYFRSFVFKMGTLIWNRLFIDEFHVLFNS